jgi:hypothetical protein
MIHLTPSVEDDDDNDDDDVDMVRSERRQRRSSRFGISVPLPPRGNAAAAATTTTTACRSNVSSSFLISIVLSSVLVYVISIMGNYERYRSPYQRDASTMRYGLGAGDAGGELQSALRRGGEGRAAVAIIRVIDVDYDDVGGSSSTSRSTGNDGGNGNDVMYLVQVKSHDYPIRAFRGAVCLLGGNANVDDPSPLDTLRRELDEELFHPTWVEKLGNVDGGGVESTSLAGTDVIDDSRNGRGNATYAPGRMSANNDTISGDGGGGVTIRFLGASMHYHTSTLIESTYPYAFLCALYEITIRSDMVPPGVAYPRGANVREGRTVLLNEDQLIRHSRYAWGYEHVIESYFGRGVTNKQVGSAVTIIDDRTWKGSVWTPGK